MKLELKQDHLIMIHAPYRAVIGRVLEMYRRGLLDAYELVIKPPLTICTLEDNGVVKEPGTVCVSFINHYWSDRFEGSAFNLIDYLLRFGVSIVIKQDNKGFEIDSQLNILKEWELEDDMS